MPPKASATCASIAASRLFKLELLVLSFLDVVGMLDDSFCHGGALAFVVADVAKGEWNDAAEEL